MKRRATLALFALAFIPVVGCSHQVVSEPVRLPPKIDLLPHERIGVVEFDSRSRGALAAMATRKFQELARRDQGLIRMVELGGKGRALASVGHASWSPAAFQAVGQSDDVRTIFLGEVTISNVKPDISLAATLRSGRITARVDATLAVQLVETDSGASLWNRSATVTRSVGHLTLLNGAGVVSFDASNPEEAYGEMVDALVEQVTRDFRASWVRR